MKKIISQESNIKLMDGALVYLSKFINEEQAKYYFDLLLNKIKWRSDSIKMFGKVLAVPRLQAWYGDKAAKYSYSNIDLEPLPWIPELKELKDKVEQFSETNFNSVLLNLYRTGKDSNGWHSDDEKELGENPEIASVTLGQERVFHLKHKTEPLRHRIMLENGSLLIMKGGTQEHWKHQIPKSAKPLKPRINLTFRRILTEIR